MALFLHHIGRKRMNVLTAVWNKFTFIWNKLKIFLRGFPYGSIVRSPCIENQPQNGFQEICVCAHVSVNIYAYILPRNYVWVCVWEHTHILSGTLGMVSEKHLGLSDLSCLNLPGGLFAALPSDTKETKVLLEAGQRLRPGWMALHVRCCEYSELRIHLNWSLSW